MSKWLQGHLTVSNKKTEFAAQDKNGLLCAVEAVGIACGKKYRFASVLWLAGKFASKMIPAVEWDVKPCYNNSYNLEMCELFMLSYTYCDIWQAAKCTLCILTQVPLLVARCRPRLQKLPLLRYLYDSLLVSCLDSELFRHCLFCCSNRVRLCWTGHIVE